MNSRSRRGVAHHVLSLFEAFEDGTPELGVADLSRRVALPRSTVHRLLQALVDRGFLVQNPQTRKYRLGWRLFTIGSLVPRQVNLHEAFRPIAEQLAATAREAIHLSVLADGDIVHVDKVESPGDVYVRSYVGQRAPVHATAGGKAILAFLPEDARARWLQQPLQRFTSSTITDPKALCDELDRIRLDGVAINRGEWREAASGVAAPVLDHRGAVVGAVGLAGPTSRLDERRLRELAPVVREAAASLSRQLGWG